MFRRGDYRVVTESSLTTRIHAVSSYCDLSCDVTQTPALNPPNAAPSARFSVDVSVPRRAFSLQCYSLSTWLVSLQHLRPDQQSDVIFGIEQWD